MGISAAAAFVTNYNRSPSPLNDCVRPGRFTSRLGGRKRRRRLKMGFLAARSEMDGGRALPGWRGKIRRKRTRTKTVVCPRTARTYVRNSRSPRFSRFVAIPGHVINSGTRPVGNFPSIRKRRATTRNAVGRACWLGGVERLNDESVTVSETSSSFVNRLT